ncbi:MAG: PEP-CTERM sorting domain-containing protein [Verrucomicrobia bacterium]|nr:PEP-CTERM sorting domain-containing protein [Verrucomicrobiota bacterium]
MNFTQYVPARSLTSEGLQIFPAAPTALDDLLGIAFDNIPRYENLRVIGYTINNHTNNNLLGDESLRLIDTLPADGTRTTLTDFAPGYHATTNSVIPNSINWQSTHTTANDLTDIRLVSFTMAYVPEPATYALIIGALSFTGVAFRRRARKNS